jgi:type IV secretory pathway TrbD component
MSAKPSRVLNDDNLFFGLDRNDIMALGLLFYLFQFFFKSFGIEYLSIVLTIISTSIVVSIRLKYRRKIIRDSIRYYLFKFIKFGVYNDSKTC